MNNLTALDIDTLLDEKPYDIDTAIFYAEQMSLRYNKLYCVVKHDNNSKAKNNYDVLGFKHYRDNIPVYILFYITNPEALRDAKKKKE